MNNQAPNTSDSISKFVNRHRKSNSEFSIVRTHFRGFSGNGSLSQNDNSATKTIDYDITAENSNDCFMNSKCFQLFSLSPTTLEQKKINEQEYQEFLSQYNNSLTFRKETLNMHSRMGSQNSSRLREIMNSNDNDLDMILDGEFNNVFASAAAQAADSQDNASMTNNNPPETPIDGSFGPTPYHYIYNFEDESPIINSFNLTNNNVAATISKSYESNINPNNQYTGVDSSESFKNLKLNINYKKNNVDEPRFVPNLPENEFTSIFDDEISDL